MDTSRVPPAVENDPALEWFSFGGHDNSVVLAHRAGPRFPPVKFKACEFQCVQRSEHVLRPLETEAAFPDPAVHEEVIKK